MLRFYILPVLVSGRLGTNRSRFDTHIRDLKLNKTATVIRASPNNTFNEPAEQWLRTCVLILGTFLCRPLQNINVK